MFYTFTFYGMYFIDATSLYVCINAKGCVLQTMDLVNTHTHARGSQKMKV